jgi:hypothetical protein
MVQVYRVPAYQPSGPELKSQYPPPEKNGIKVIFSVKDITKS